MNRIKNIGLALYGTVLGLALSVPTAQAVESLKATLSTNRILVDGQEVKIEAYAIHDNNFMQLRDVGKAVGFNVYWDGDTKTVQIETGKPYTGEAPAKDKTADSASQPESIASVDDVDTMKQDVVDRTNALRAEQGISTLKVNQQLMQAAQVRADEMAANGVYSHTRPDGRKYDTVTDCKYVGENIHQIPLLYLEQQKIGLAEAAVQLWSKSPDHAENMTDAAYSMIGVGLARGTDGSGMECWYCVQLFLWNGYDIGWIDTPSPKAK